jgi:hypothetical protein
MTIRVVSVAAAAAVALAMAVPSMAQDRRADNAGQCWKATDSTKPYGYWGACPKRTAAPRRTTRTVATPPPYAARPGQCWKRTDSTKPYGYWGDCPAPQRTAAFVPPGPSDNPHDRYAGAWPGHCWKATDGTKPYGYWAEC